MRDLVPLKDGGQISIDWLWPDNGKEDKINSDEKVNIIVVFTGLGGNSRSDYI